MLKFSHNLKLVLSYTECVELQQGTVLTNKSESKHIHYNDIMVYVPHTIIRLCF